MTQTLTTKVLNDFITGQGYGVAPSAVEAMARELLANREAQPVEFDWNSVQEFWRNNPHMDWEELEGAILAGIRHSATPAPAVRAANCQFCGRRQPDGGN